jgi:hypothetical protein
MLASSEGQGDGSVRMGREMAREGGASRTAILISVCPLFFAPMSMLLALMMSPYLYVRSSSPRFTPSKDTLGRMWGGATGRT